MVEGCIACSVGAGVIEAPGGCITETESWAADHCVGPYGVGAVVIRTKEHVEDFWRLGEQALAELGPLLRDVSAAIVDARGAERVYVTMWVDKQPHHVHMVVFPRWPSDQERGPGLLAKHIAAGSPPAKEAAAAAAVLREHLLRGTCLDGPASSAVG